jgi:tetratricopeptide (TPR) repeat protein
MRKNRRIIDELKDKNRRKLNYLRSFWICIALALAATAVYYQVWTYSFINLDDSNYIYQNQNIQGGITLKAVEWAFNSGQAYFWHPLTWLSHMLDWQLFGSNAGGHHLTSLIFHIANTLLLFIVLKKMTGALWPSAFVAALFALHPLHVESVAWVYERKDVLSTFFWMLTMWAYVRFVGRPKITNYLLIVVFLALGLMAKPMLVTLPFVLLLLDYWPLQRFNTKRSLSLLIEKVPLFAMVLASCIVTFVNQKKIGAMSPTENLSLLFRLANASISYMQYIIKMIWPVRLAIFYPHPLKNVSILYAVISAIFLLIVTVIVLRFSRNYKYLVTGWLWYIGTLVPVIGLVQVGDQAMADRYSYITLTGLFIIIAWGLSDLSEKWPHRKTAIKIFSLAVLFALAILTYLQQQYWKNSITVFQHTLGVTNNNYVAHCHIAEVFLEHGLTEEAIWHNTEAVRIKPDYHSAVNNLGVALYKAGRIDKAIGYYKRAIEISPGTVEFHVNLGAAFSAKGKFAEAVKEYEKVLLIQPQNAAAHNNLGVALFRQEKFDEAIEHFSQAIQIDSNCETARNGLDLALAEKQKLQNKNTGQ